MGDPPSATDDGDDDVFFELLNRARWARRELMDVAAFLIYDKFPETVNITSFFRYPPGLNLIAASADCEAFRGDKAVFSRLVVRGPVQYQRRSNGEPEVYMLLPDKRAFTTSSIGLVAILNAFAHRRNQRIYQAVKHSAINRQETAKVAATISALTHHRVQREEFRHATWYLQKLVVCFAAAYKLPAPQQCVGGDWRNSQETWVLFHRMMLHFDRWITELVSQPNFSLPPGSTLEYSKNGAVVSLDFETFSHIQAAESTSYDKYDAVNVLNAILSATAVSKEQTPSWPDGVLVYRKGGPPPTLKDVHAVYTMLKKCSAFLCTRYSHHPLELNFFPA